MVLARVITRQSGSAAVFVMTGLDDPGGSQDYELAVQDVLHLVPDRSAAIALVEQCKGAAIKLLERQYSALPKLTRALTRADYLSGDQATRIVGRVDRVAPRSIVPVYPNY